MPLPVLSSTWSPKLRRPPGFALKGCRGLNQVSCRVVWLCARRRLRASVVSTRRCASATTQIGWRVPRTRASFLWLRLQPWFGIAFTPAITPGLSKMFIKTSAAWCAKRFCASGRHLLPAMTHIGEKALGHRCACLASLASSGMINPQAARICADEHGPYLIQMRKLAQSVDKAPIPPAANCSSSQQSFTIAHKSPLPF